MLAERARGVARVFLAHLTEPVPVLARRHLLERLRGLERALEDLAGRRATRGCTCAGTRRPRRGTLERFGVARRVDGGCRREDQQLAVGVGCDELARAYPPELAE